MDFRDNEWTRGLNRLENFKIHTRKSSNLFVKLFGGKSFAYTATIGSSIVIAFKSTRSVGDGFANIAKSKKDFLVGGTTFKVHRGFLHYYNLIRKDVLGAVDILMSSFPAKELLVTGYSLGGALANLGALDLAFKYTGVKVSLWTFASPRVFAGNIKSPRSVDNSAFIGKSHSRVPYFSCMCYNSLTPRSIHVCAHTPSLPLIRSLTHSLTHSLFKHTRSSPRHPTRYTAISQVGI